MPPGGVAARVIALRRNSKNAGELQAQAREAKKRKAMPLPRPLLVGLSKFDNRREEPHGADEESSIKCADDKGNLIGVCACILRHKVKTAEVYSSSATTRSICSQTSMDRRGMLIQACVRRPTTFLSSKLSCGECYISIPKSISGACAGNRSYQA
eukprot:6209630-Pleurochrysis_carterae.AAC.2